MDEMIEIVRGLMIGDYFEYHGQFYDLPSIKLSPVPNGPLPILVGGQSDAALRRAARLGDGWLHAGSDPEELQAFLDRLRSLRHEYGRENEPFEVHVISLDAYSVDGVRRLEEMGVTDVVVGFRDAYQMSQDNEPLQKKIDDLTGFAEDVIAKVNA